MDDCICNLDAGKEWKFYVFISMHGRYTAQRDCAHYSIRVNYVLIYKQPNSGASHRSQNKVYNT